MGAASFMLGLASGFLVCAMMSFGFNGLFGPYYLLIGGISAAASVGVALFSARRAGEDRLLAAKSQP